MELDQFGLIFLKRLKIYLIHPIPAVKLSGCSALTTTAIRRIVDLCGASLRRLDIAQCGNIYATALWYLCGLFQGG